MGAMLSPFSWERFTDQHINIYLYIDDSTVKKKSMMDFGPSALMHFALEHGGLLGHA
jgi:hypothetical protein